MLADAQGMGLRLPGGREAGLDTLGIDVGSVSVKAVILSDGGEVRFASWRRTHGRPLDAVAALMGDAARALGADAPIVATAVTGSGKGLLAEAVEARAVNEIIAHATGAWTLHPEVRSIIEIGGQDSKFVRIDRDPTGRPFVGEHAFNELCAAGTGAFLDQMAERLGMPIEAFSQAAADAPRPARVAGRCSVFAKTDLIHLQQRACPPGEIVAGVCFALARTFLASLCHGRPPQTPVLFQGGVAANAGVVRAFRELLGAAGTGLIVPEHHKVMGAYGAALAARDVPWPHARTLADVAARMPTSVTDAQDGPGPEPLGRFASRFQTPSPHGPGAGSAGHSDVATDAWLGIDVGSVSTKAVVIDAQDRVRASSYLPTAGRPTDAIRQTMAALAADLGSDIRIRRSATTGSGRHLARNLIGADEVIDEITAQARAATWFAPDADTVFEIGGQDAKYMGLAGGRLARFQMNRACAAGTGAFLEEQSGRLGIDVRRDFAALALESSRPVRLGSRCTVFMDSDLVHHLQHGASLPDLCAGLAYAVARNYLDKVVGSRPIGQRILFQGGVARNDAVRAALAGLLGREIRVPPHPEVSGAFGAALIAREPPGIQGGAPTSEAPAFQGFQALESPIDIRTFDCRSCENHCEIQQIEHGSQQRTFFGSVCGRFEQGREAPLPANDAFSEREHLRDACAQADPLPGVPHRGPIGFPMALSLVDHLPFWRTFLVSLGFDVTPSGPTDRHKAALGLARVPEEFCQPVKVLFGHVHHLIENGATRLFVPHLRMMRPAADTANRYACPYTQGAPYVVRAHLADAAPHAQVLALEFPVPGEEAAWTTEVARTLGVPKGEVREAYRRASDAQKRFVEGCRAAGSRLLADLAARGQPGAVLLGRPYNTSDRCMNLNLARRLAGMGIAPIPHDFLPLQTEALPDYWARVRWGFGREQLQAARLVRRTPNLSAVIVTNFGCGPDAFVDQYLEDELADTPHLVLEFDDHQAEAGLVTRLEAFARHVRAETRGAPAGRTERRRGASPGTPTRPLREYTYWVPYVSDHARAFVGALHSVGCRAVLLPPTDDASWQLGLQHAYGRECHPYVALLGDLLKASRRPDFVPDEACYYGPSYFGPCLLPQYMVAMKLVLDRIGLGDVSLINIADPPTMAPLGRDYVARLGLGLYAIDRLYKWKVESEPYEQAPGSVVAAYAQALDRIEDGLARRRFWKALPEAAAILRAVPTRPDPAPRQRIGVIGDAYTRINAHANDRLYDRLGDMGFEVWSSCSLIDVSLLGAEQLHAELARRGRPVAGRLARAAIPGVALLRARIDRHFPEAIRTPQERQFPDVSRVADTYASHWIDKALSLNLSRVEELHQAGAAGVVNAMCHNCMLGTVTAALLPRMRRDYPGLATCTLVYEGLQSIHNINRLEAFADQVRSLPRAPERGAGAPATAADGITSALDTGRR